MQQWWQKKVEAAQIHLNLFITMFAILKTDVNYNTWLRFHFTLTLSGVTKTHNIHLVPHVKLQHNLRLVLV